MKRLTSIFSIFFVFLLFVNSELCSQPPFRIGIVLSLGGLFDRSFNDATYVGIQKLRQNKNLLIDVFEPSDIKAIENGIEYFCHQNLDLIIGVGIFSNDPIRIASEKYPKQKFVILDSVVSSPNVLSIIFNEEEGSFYAGALAGLLTKSNQVGFLGGMVSPIISAFEKGFRNGIGFVNPSANLVVKYAGETPEAFNSPEIGKSFGKELSAAGVDVVYHASGRTGLGLIEAARQMNFKVIGVDTDQSTLAPGKVISSMVKRLDIALEKAYKALSESRFKGGILTLGLADVGVELVFSRFNQDLITPLIRERLAEVEGFLLHRTANLQNHLPRDKN